MHVLRKCALILGPGVLSVLCAQCLTAQAIEKVNYPIVINTWAFTNATESAWQSLSKGQSALDAVEAGCTSCEVEQCDGTVGYGGSPDESGETTLDAMIMDGNSIDVGAVANLRKVKQAISVARAVMDYTKHTLLAGDQATQFAESMGFSKTDLHTNESIDIWKSWKNNNCQPNFRQNVSPNPTTSCGPYKPTRKVDNGSQKQRRYNGDVSSQNHDTIGLVAIDSSGSVAAGTSTNGANHKVPGRVGDSPIVGAGCYADSDVGGAAATGDGDVMMRFLPSFHVVELMRDGHSPSAAASTVVAKIAKKYPDFVGAIIAISSSGTYGAACHGIKSFPFSVRAKGMKSVTVEHVQCLKSY